MWAGLLLASLTNPRMLPFRLGILQRDLEDGILHDCYNRQQDGEETEEKQVLYFLKNYISFIHLFSVCMCVSMCLCICVSMHVIP